MNDVLTYSISITPDMQLVTEALTKMGGTIDNISKQGMSKIAALFSSMKDGASKVASGSMALGKGISGAVSGASQAAGTASGGLAIGALAGLDEFSKTLSLLQGQLGPIDLGLAVFSKTISGIGSLVKKVAPEFAPLIDALTAIPMVVSGILGSLTSMAGMANPASVQQFSYALEDVQAIIGQTFLPILNLMTEGVRTFGDVMATVLPSTEEVVAVLNEFRNDFSGIMSEFRILASEFAPLIKDTVLLWIKGVAMILVEVGHAAVIAARHLHEMLSPLMEFLGVSTTPGAINSSVGAAARPAQIQGIDSYLTQLQTAAASQGTGPSGPDMPVMVSRIGANLDRLVAYVERLTPEAIGLAVASAIARLAPSSPTEALRFGVNLLVPGASAAEAFWNWYSTRREE